jgi:competence protein ComEC
MSDGATVLMALAAAGGAWLAAPVPLLAALVVCAAGLAGRWALVLIVGAGLLTSALAVRSRAGLQPPVVGVWVGTATLVGDPQDVAGAVRVDLRIRGKHVEAWAHGRAAASLRPRLAGERVALSGRIQAVPAPLRVRLARRHVAARMSVRVVGTWAPGDPASQLANGIRRTLERGAESLSPTRRALLLGFVLGDDRGQPAEVTDDFRGSGLAHLLVVSGENLAFVLALTGPLLRRLGLGSRLVAGLLLLTGFGVLTRWEPSVMRAVAMVAVSLLASAMGRPVSRLRLLALAVTAVLVVDPLLVGSVGFLLSVGACTGIALLARPLADALPGPRPLISPLAVTVAAQLGVAPVLVPVFGGVPVASLPANLLALPAAGPVMMWGLAAGVPAGLVGGAAARLVHVPTSLLIAWVAAVARWAAASPLGQLGAVHLVALGVVLVIGAVARARRRRSGQWAALAGAVVVLAAPSLGALRPADVWASRVLDGARLWRVAGASVLVVDDAGPDQLLRAARAANLRRLDLLVVTRDGASAERAVYALVRKVHPRAVLRPPSSGRAIVGPLVVDVDQVGRRLRVEVHRRPRGPPSVNPPRPRW